MFKDHFFYISLLFFVAGIIIVVSSNVSYAMPSDTVSKKEEKKEVTTNQENLEEEITSPLEIKLTFIGDSLIGSLKGERYDMNFQDLLEKHDYSYPYHNVKAIFENDDFTIANGENVFTDRNLQPSFKDYTPAYWYFSESKYANVYKESSIEVVSTQNNHTTDYGNEGYQDTIKALEDAQVIVGGEDPVILTKEDRKIALLCTNLFHDFQATEVINKIKKVKEEVDYVIVYFHGGVEYSFTPTDDIVKYAHSFVDNGADLVIGAHPHVLEPMETYKNKKIVYSLGSFLFGGTLNFKNRTVIYQVTLEFNHGVSFKDNLIPCYLYSGTVGYDKWLPGVIENEDERKLVLDFMKGLRSEPY